MLSLPCSSDEINLLRCFSSWGHCETFEKLFPEQKVVLFLCVIWRHLVDALLYRDCRTKMVKKHFFTDCNNNPQRAICCHGNSYHICVKPPKTPGPPQFATSFPFEQTYLAITHHNK